MIDLKPSTAHAPMPSAASGRRGGAYVHHGSLDVPAGAESDYEAAVGYLRKDPVMASIIDRIQNGPAHVTMHVNDSADDSYDPWSHELNWDPHSALETTAGGHQTPALGLGHEMDHATVDPAVGSRLAGIYDAKYDNAEERRVIEGSEKHAAATLGEGMRHDHGGQPYVVATPVSW